MGDYDRGPADLYRDYPSERDRDALPLDNGRAAARGEGDQDNSKIYVGNINYKVEALWSSLKAL